MHVLVGTDGSQLAVSASRHGIALLNRPDHVTALTVITKVSIGADEDSEESFSWPDDHDRRWQAQIDDANAAFGRTAAALVGARVDS